MKYKLSHVFAVPPQTPVILGPHQDVILGAEIGPYEIGESLSVTCEVAGGEDKSLLPKSLC